MWKTKWMLNVCARQFVVFLCTLSLSFRLYPISSPMYNFWTFITTHVLLTIDIMLILSPFLSFSRYLVRSIKYLLWLPFDHQWLPLYWFFMCFEGSLMTFRKKSSVKTRFSIKNSQLNHKPHSEIKYLRQWWLATLVHLFLLYGSTKVLFIQVLFSFCTFSSLENVFKFIK